MHYVLRLDKGQSYQAILSKACPWIMLTLPKSRGTLCYNQLFPIDCGTTVMENHHVALQSTRT